MQVILDLIAFLMHVWIYSSHYEAILPGDVFSTSMMLNAQIYFRIFNQE